MSAPSRVRSSLGLAPSPATAFALAAALTLALMLLVSPALAGTTETIAVSEDTWIDGLASTTPQGSNPILGICPRQDYWIYLKFDLSTLSGPPTDAEIRMTRTAGARPEEISIYLVTDDSWDEATLTGVDRPAPTMPDPADALGVGEEILPYDRWTSPELTDAIAQEFAGDGVLSVMIREDPILMFDVRQYASREAAVGPDERPLLVVTTDATAIDERTGEASWGSVKAGYR